MKRYCFTLIELLIAIGIMLILAAMVAAGVSMASRKGDEAKTRALMAKMEIALEQYLEDWGYYPEQAEDELTFTRFEDPNGDLYLDEDTDPFKDAFGTAFRYKSPGVHNPESYDLWSFGADTDDDSGGEDDIANWKQQ